MKKICLILIGLIIANLINVSALSIAVHVPEKYTDVTAGERFYFEIEVKYPENPKRKDLRLEYKIITPEGKLIAQTKALKAIETQASFIDFIVIPENTKSGLHMISVEISDYEDLSEEVNASFQVVKDSADQIKFYFFILLGVIVLVGSLVVFSLFRRRK